MNVYWCPDPYNVGDTLTRPILERLIPGEAIYQVGPDVRGKLLGVGSILWLMRERDIVWGAGAMRQAPHPVPLGVKFLAVRGPITRELLHGGKVPETYGDPGLLMPIVYRPASAKKYAVGIVPHYVDKKCWRYSFQGKDEIDFSSHVPPYIRVLNVAWPWKKFIDELLSCERIVSSSLHGLVLAEAYGIPAEWRVWSDKVIGRGFKFRDYLAGTGRKPQDPGEFPPIPDLWAVQRDLIDALAGWWPSALPSHFASITS